MFLRQLPLRCVSRARPTDYQSVNLFKFCLPCSIKPETAKTPNEVFACVISPPASVWNGEGAEGVETPILRWMADRGGNVALLAHSLPILQAT